jgi:GntR family transcriptional regulator, transcriptional repressor for pyruvate dehydrogenase complex
MLQAVTRDQTLTERARQQFEELIVSGKLRPGDRLPSESEMGKMLGVSRTVVREAVRLLSAKGLVEARTGSGIYVRELNSGMIRDPIELLLRCSAIRTDDILEARALIEVHLAGLAAERATSDDIAAMERAIAKLRKTGLSPTAYAEIDVEFHAQLAVAARNPLFGILSQSLIAVMIDPIRFVFEHRASAREDTIREHRLILDHVKARDPEGARQAMREALSDAPYNWGGYPPREPTLIPKLAKRAKSPESPNGNNPARERKPTSSGRYASSKGAR